MRVTRAAQRAQQDVEEPVATAEVDERILKDIEPNSAPAEHLEEPVPAKTPAKTPAKKGKAKGAKKGAKGRKAKIDEDDAAQTTEEAEQDAAASPEVDQEPIPDVAENLNDDEQPEAPRTPAVRLTRRQLAKLEEEEAQRGSSSHKEDPTEDVAEQIAEQAETVVSDAGAPVAQEEHTKPEPQPATKPARRTRRQQTKLEADEPEQHMVEDTADVAPEQTEAPVAIEDEADTEKSEPLIVQESTEVKPETEPKVKRLTRRQQAKLEEEQEQEQQRLQHEQQTAPSEPTETEVSKEIVTETHLDADTEQEDGVPVAATTKIEDGLAPVVDVEGQEEPALAPQESEAIEANTELPAEGQIVNSEVSPMPGAKSVPIEPIDERPMTPTDAEFEADFEADLDAQIHDAPSDGVLPSVENVPEAEPKMLSAEKPFDTTVSTPTKKESSTRRSSRSPSKSPMRLEESISAIDRLEEDLESIGEAIPDLDHSEDEKLAQDPTNSLASTSVKKEISGKTPAKTPVKAPARASAKSSSKTPSKTPAKAPVPAKAAPAAAKAPLPTRISRVPNAVPKSVKPATTPLARASSVRTVPNKEANKPSTEAADYLASKRRPISLSFPTPPPPPKGRAPTKPTFQLSSETVAAKLRAQKEERQKREAEGAPAPKQRPISMPPPPKSTKPPTVPSFQLPGEATAARLKAQKEERLKRMQEAGKADRPATRPISMPPPPKSTKQVTKPSFQLPGEATAARLKAQKEERLKRMEEAEAAKKAALAAPVRKPIAHRPRASLLVKDAPGVSIPPPPQADAPQRSSSLANKRNSIIGPSASRSTSTSSANRNSALLAEGGKSAVTPVDAAALKVKGKQVFNRDRMEKEAAERERKEKEEAAKKARAEAAERGRIASREWAERQRKKMMGQ